MIGLRWSLLWLAAAAYFGRLLVNGFRTGMMEGKFRSYDRVASPINFWISALLNLIIVAASVWFVVKGFTW